MFNLNIHNFRSFQHQNFEFSKVNLLIGTNSSGKSSLLKFLRMLKQSTESKDGVLNLRGRNFGELDLGNYKEIIYNNDTSLNLEFGFEVQARYIIQVLNSLKKEFGQKIIESTNHMLSTFNNVDFTNEDRISYQFVFNKNIQNYEEQLFLSGASGEIGVTSLNSIRLKKKDVGNLSISFIADVALTHNDKETIIKDAEGMFTGFLYFLSRTSDKKVYSISAINFLMLRFLLSTIRYVNPLNTTPQKNYIKRDDRGVVEDVHNLEDVVNFLADESIEASEKRILVEKLQHAIVDLGIAKEIKLVTNPGSDIMELKVRVSDGDFWSNITNVGYGVGLQLPMLLQAIVSEHRGGEIVLLEQPEIHTHPRLHAKLLETFVNTGKSNTYFIETHSADMVRELQVLVKQGVLKPEDVTVHYFTREATQTRVVAHHLDKDGMFDIEIPADFYENYYNIGMQLLP